MCVRMRVGTPTRMSSCALQGHVHPTLGGKDKLLVEINQISRPRRTSNRNAQDTDPNALLRTLSVRPVFADSMFKIPNALLWALSVRPSGPPTIQKSYDAHCSELQTSHGPSFGVRFKKQIKRAKNPQKKQTKITISKTLYAYESHVNCHSAVKKDVPLFHDSHAACH